MTATYRDRRSLWKGVGYGGRVARLGRTNWTLSPYWMAHTSVIGGMPEWKQLVMSHVDLLSAADITKTIAAHTADARPAVFATDGITRYWGGAGEPCAVVGNGRHLYSWDRKVTETRFGAIRVGFDLAWFEAMQRSVMAHTPAAELRLDPWRCVASWWSPRGYPIAVLVGMASRLITLPGEEAPE